MYQARVIWSARSGLIKSEELAPGRACLLLGLLSLPPPTHTTRHTHHMRLGRRKRHKKRKNLKQQARVSDCFSLSLEVDFLLSRRPLSLLCSPSLHGSTPSPYFLCLTECLFKHFPSRCRSRVFLMLAFANGCKIMTDKSLLLPINFVSLPPSHMYVIIMHSFLSPSPFSSLSSFFFSGLLSP